MVQGTPYKKNSKKIVSLYWLSDECDQLILNNLEKKIFRYEITNGRVEINKFSG